MLSNLSPDLQELVDVQIATGDYTDTDAVLRDALTVFAKYRETASDLRASLSDIQAGRVRPLAEVARDIRERHGWSNP